jgi:SanA protein
MIKSNKKNVATPLSTGIIFILIFTIFLLLSQYKVNTKYNDNIYTVNNVPSTETGLILGATVWENKIPSDILADRLLVGIHLYKNGKIKKIIVSGADDSEYYNEVQVMKNFLLQHAIKEQDIIMDHAGFTTYHSLYRAKTVMSLNSLIIITNRYHLPRALYIAHELGINATGVDSDLRRYTGDIFNNFREFFARIKANIDLIFKPQLKSVRGLMDIYESGQITGN